MHIPQEPLTAPIAALTATRSLVRLWTSSQWWGGKWENPASLGQVNYIADRLLACACARKSSHPFIDEQKPAMLRRRICFLRRVFWLVFFFLSAPFNTKRH